MTIEPSARGMAGGGSEGRVMDSMRTFLLRPLPAGLEPLARLAADLHWVWSHAGGAVWRLVNPDIWDRTQNPWITLQECPQVRLNTLAQDPRVPG